MIGFIKSPFDPPFVLRDLAGNCSSKEQSPRPNTIKISNMICYKYRVIHHKWPPFS